MIEIKRLLSISFFTNLSISILWTGLPILLYTMTESLIVSSALFITASVARIVAAFISGYFIDNHSNKKIMIISLSIMMTISLFILMFLIYEWFIGLFLIMIVYQFFGQITALSKNIWYRDLVNKENLVQAISKMSSYDMSSKTIGFTLGPLIFSLINEYTVLINSLLLMIVIIMVFNIHNDAIKPVKNTSSVINQYISSMRYIFNNRILFNYAVISIFIGIIGPTLLSLATYIIGERYNLTEEVSIFWLSSGVGVVISNLFLSKVRKTFVGSNLYFILAFITYSIGIFIFTNASTYVIFIIGFTMFTLGGPLIMNVVQTNIFINTDGKIKGKIIGVIQALSDFGTLITIVFSWIIIERFTIDLLLYYLFILSIVTIITLYITFKKFTEKRFLN